MRILQSVLLTGMIAHQLSAQTEERMQTLVDSFYTAHPSCTGIMVSVVAPGNELSWNYAAGYSNKQTREEIAADQPVLLASNTKTYVSATILKLVEQKKLQLSDPMENYLPDSLNENFREAGYHPDQITIRHLLSHTSGIRDYVDDGYFTFVNTKPDYEWTREEQIDRALKLGAPLSLPADTFSYADVNYLLLTKIIEKITERPFYRAMRELLNYDQLGLHFTWFVKLEESPPGVKPRVHQYWNKFEWDSYNMDLSWDLYGGGGIAATTHDLANFFQSLFEGKIIQDKALLSEIHTVPPSSVKTNYCLGLRKLEIAGLQGYYHGGFWGTDAIYFPALNASIAIAILEKNDRGMSADVCRELVMVLKSLGNN